MGVARTLLNRCKEIVTDEIDREKERDTIKTALKTCGYPEWTLNRVEQSMREKESNKKKDNSRKEEEKNKGMVVLPYVSGVSEKLARIFVKRKISSAMKPHTKIRALLVHPKDKTDPKEGVCTIDCKGCEKTYVGKTKRKLQVSVKEHRSETEKVSKGTNSQETRKNYHKRRCGGQP